MGSLNPQNPLFVQTTWRPFNNQQIQVLPIPPSALHPSFIEFPRPVYPLQGENPRIRLFNDIIPRKVYFTFSPFFDTHNSYDAGVIEFYTSIINVNPYPFL